MNATRGNRVAALLELWTAFLRSALTTNRLSRWCPIVAACFVWAASGPVGANITDCIGANSDGGVPGQAICAPIPVPTPATGVLPGWSDLQGWTHHLCDEAGAHSLREKAWCESAGGTFMGLY